MRALKHLERARELLQPKLGFGAYKESPSDIKLVNMPGAIRGGKEYDVIIGYQVTLQPIKVGQFPTTEPPSNTDELARYLDEKAKYYVKKREEYHSDRGRMDAGEFDEVLGEIERNTDIFTIEEPLNRYDFRYKYGSYIVAVINDIKEPDGSELARTAEEVIHRNNYQRPNWHLNNPSAEVVEHRLASTSRMLKLLHKPMLLCFELKPQFKLKPGSKRFGHIQMYHLNGMEVNILPCRGNLDDVDIRVCKDFYRGWDLVDPQWNDQHPLFKIHTEWQYLLHKCRHLVPNGRIIDRGAQQRRKK